MVFDVTYAVGSRSDGATPARPARCTTTSTPANGIAGSGSRGLFDRVIGHEVEAGDLVALAAQALDHVTSDESLRPRDENPHLTPPRGP